jgi:CRISPR-associated helicase Cas3/CRISPR-associated endonuclease Cas3-HD
VQYYAHSSDDSERPWQTIKDHAKNTANLAGNFASKFNASDFGYICGILHDIGKYSQSFQKKLCGEKIIVDHSSAGAQLSIDLYGEAMGKLLSYCISGHHSGLLDHGTAISTEGTLYARLHKEVENFAAYKNELGWISSIRLPRLPITIMDSKRKGFALSFFIRMLFSCLVDADFIDTENFIFDKSRLRRNNSTIHDLQSIFNKFIINLSNNNSKINSKRKEILDVCLAMAKNRPGLFTLTVPTGGGKTYSSLAFALNHAVINGLERIIYIIPYTSIIEQNAGVFKNILGEENVLEHHSNYQFDQAESEDFQTVKMKLKLASENWDIPIIVTTNVQFFESLFSNRSSKCRKLHNMTKSILIFDEAQMLPISYLRAGILGISELVKNYGSTVLLSTATPPHIGELFPSTMELVEMMPDPKKLYNDFRKVEIIKKGKMGDDILAEEINRNKQVLCIVNTRKHAREIYHKLKVKEKPYHLSTLMCPIHRQKVFRKIRKNLKESNTCRVISTQLIEAGVDIDFPVVYRSIAGIDSIIQSAGRCNREGKLKTGYVYIFEPDSEYAIIKGYLERTASITKNVLRKYKDPISLEAVDYYFQELYDLEGRAALDKKGVLDCFEIKSKSLEFDFKTAGESFKIIDDNTFSIIIPYQYQEDKNSDEYLAKLLHEAAYTPYPVSVARKLQPYTVEVYKNDYCALQSRGVLKTLNDSFIVLEDYENYYDEYTGLLIPIDIEEGEGIFV